MRDGLQQPDLEISVPNAVRCLQRMAAFGVRYAEIGFAGANQFVSDLTSALESVDTGAMTLALFGRTRGRGAKVEDWPDLEFIVRHKRRIPVAVVVVKSRLLDVERSLGTTPEENLLMAWDTIEYLHANGLEVFVDLEHAMDANCGRCENGIPCDADFSKRSLDHFRQLTEQCVRQKVSRIVVCDTNGGSSPEEVTQVFEGLDGNFPEAKFGFHGHTDRGFGVANTRAAILAGAVQVQGTLIGTGERCGNVNLTTVVGSMQLRGEAEFVPPQSAQRPHQPGALRLCSLRARSAARRAHRGPGRIRHVGRHARLQRAQEPRRVSLVRSRACGRSPTIGVNAQSGKANIMLLSESSACRSSGAQAQALMDANQAMIEGGGFTASEVSFRLACMKTLGTLRNWFSVKSWRVFDESDEIGGRFVQAFMTLIVGDGTVAPREPKAQARWTR